MQRHLDKEYISLALSIWERNGVFKNEAPYITPVLLILTVLQHMAATNLIQFVIKKSCRVAFCTDLYVTNSEEILMQSTTKHNS